MVWLKKNKALIFILVLVFLLRLPSLFEPFVYGDEGIYLTLGQSVRKGVVLYREIHDNKPPFLYWLAALAGNFTYFRFLLLIWSLATVTFFFYLTKLLFPKKPKAIVLSTGLFALLTTLRTFEGNIANAENFMLLPTIAGFWLILKNRKSKKSWLFFHSGILFALAALFKIPAAFDFGAALVLIIVLFWKKKRFAIRHSLFAVLGFLLPFLITFVYFASQGASREYFMAAFAQNLPYLSSWGKQSQDSSLPFGLLSRGVFLLGMIIVIFYYQKKFSLTAKIALIWFAFSFFAALLSSRPYPHYLLQIIPSLSLSFGLLAEKTREKLIPFLLFFIFSFSFLAFRFWYYPNLSYYLNFVQFALKTKSQEDYFTAFDSQANAIYQVSEYLRGHNRDEEPIFIWGTRPSIYSLARRLPVGRYTVSYHIIDFDGYQETINVLKTEKPLFIIKVKGERKFADLDGLVAANYLRVTTIDDMEIYRRLP